jgi:hypothetical protein
MLNPPPSPADPLPCPVGPDCEVCGSGGLGLARFEADTSLGVICVVLCPVCADTAELPRLSLVEASRRVLEHCAHTEGTLDEPPFEEAPW